MAKCSELWFAPAFLFTFIYCMDWFIHCKCVYGCYVLHEESQPSLEKHFRW